MIVLACVDEHNGLLFNHRRQSRDAALCRNILDAWPHQSIHMNAYSSALFSAYPQRIICAEDFLETAIAGDVCFVETEPLLPHLSRIEQLVLYRWHRHYPADVDLDLPLSQFICTEKEDFAGTSHETITKEVYRL